MSFNNEESININANNAEKGDQACFAGESRKMTLDLIKQKKRERHKLWQKRHRKRLQKKKKQTEKRNEEWIKEVQWQVTMAPSFNALKLKKEAEKKQKKKKRNMISKMNELKECLKKLVELRSLRRKKLEAKGHFFADEGDEFFNKVSQENQAMNTEEKIQVKSTVSNIDTQDNWNEMEIDKEAYDYWCEADHSLNGLLKIRRQWDQYIRTDSNEQDRFHKVPPNFVIPPPPANAVWASYLFIQ